MFENGSHEFVASTLHYVTCNTTLPLPHMQNFLKKHCHHQDSILVSLLTKLSQLHVHFALPLSMYLVSTKAKWVCMSYLCPGKGKSLWGLEAVLGAGVAESAEVSGIRVMDG